MEQGVHLQGRVDVASEKDEAAHSEFSEACDLFALGGVALKASQYKARNRVRLIHGASTLRLGRTG